MELKEKVANIIYGVHQSELGKGDVKDYEPHIKCGKIIFKKDTNSKNKISVYFEDDSSNRVKIDLHEYGAAYYCGLARIKNHIKSEEEDIYINSLYLHNYFDFLFKNNDGVYEF